MHDHDRTYHQPAAEGGPHHDHAEPGRSSRTQLLRKPATAIASGLIQRAARDGNGVAEGADRAVAAAASSTGAPLPDRVMRKFEASLGADLSGVRVHTGDASAAASDAVGARAYTLGQDIHFAAGHYDPASPAGEHLLAHEVAHTVQQAGGARRMQYKLDVSSPGDHLEHEADRAADAMVLGQPASASASHPLARQVSRDKAAGDAQGAEVSNAEAIAALRAARTRLRTTIQLLTTTQVACQARLKGAATNYGIVRGVHDQVWDKYLAETNEQNAEQLSAWLERTEAKEHLHKIWEYEIKGAITLGEMLAEHSIGPLAAALGYVLDIGIGVATTGKMEPPPKPTPLTASAFTKQDVDALIEQIAKSSDVIECGIAGGRLSGKEDGLSQRIEDLMASHEPSPPEQVAKLAATAAACSKVDAAARQLTARCLEFQRQSWIQAALADPQKLLAGLRKKTPEAAHKAELAAKAIGKMAQLVTAMKPTGTAKVGADSFEARIMAGPTAASTGVPGMFRRVVGSDGAALILDYQDDPSTANLALPLIGTYVTTLENLGRAGTVLDGKGNQHPARSLRTDDMIPCGAHVKVVATDNQVLVLDALTTNADAKGAYASYQPGEAAPDLYFPIAKANPAKPPYQFGYDMVPGPPGMGMIYLKRDFKLVRTQGTGNYWVEPLETPRNPADYELYYHGKQ